MNARGLVLFPGAGSDSQHSALIAIEQAVAPIPTLRVDFPYRLAVREFAKQLQCNTEQLVIGGRSMGGRMCTMAASDEVDPLKVLGIACIGYPLHPPKKPDKLRTEHFGNLHSPLLFISGTRDEFGTPEELELAWKLLPKQPTVQMIEKGRHELRGADAQVATLVAQWLQNL
jgi:predicted alpha/beta-hydrolase family hydrolase